MQIAKFLKPARQFYGNFWLFFGFAFALAAWACTPHYGDGPVWSWAAVFVLAAFSLVFSYRGYTWIRYSYLQRKGWEAARTTNTRKDDRLASKRELKQAGMLTPTGRLLGQLPDGDLLFEPTSFNPAFHYFLGGQGTGKTSTQAVASAILTPLTTGKSVFLNDSKKEITPQVINALKGLGVKVMCINIGPGVQDTCPGVQTPPFELAVDSYYSDDPEQKKRVNVFIRGYSEIIVEEDEDGKNAKFFIVNARTCFQAILVHELMFNPERAVPTRIQQIASDLPKAIEILKRLKNHKADDNDTVAGDARRAASTILAMHKDNPKYLPQFLNLLVNGLACYDSTGPLANFGEFAAARISDMRRKQMVVASMIPLSDLHDMRVHTSLMSYNFFMSAKVIPDGVKMHGLLDEFTTLNIPNFADEMLTLRGLGVSAEMYIQSRLALERRMGKLEAQTVFEQSDVLQMTGVTTLEDAKFVSEASGTINSKEYRANIDGADFGGVAFGLEDKEEHIFTPQEVLATPRDEQFIKIRGMRMTRGKKLPWWEVEGLRDILDENPIEGTAPKADATAALKITKRGVKVLRTKKPKQKTRGEKPHRNPRKEWWVRPTSFVWLYAWLIILGGSGLPMKKPVPHFHYGSSYGGCEYVSIHGAITTKATGYCPPIWLRQGRAQ